MQENGPVAETVVGRDASNEADAQPVPEQPKRVSRRRAGAAVAAPVVEEPTGMTVVDAMHPPELEEHTAGTFEAARAAGYYGRRPKRPDYTQRGVLPYRSAL